MILEENATADERLVINLPKSKTNLHPRRNVTNGPGATDAQDIQLSYHGLSKSQSEFCLEETRTQRMQSQQLPLKIDSTVFSHQNGSLMEMSLKPKLVSSDINSANKIPSASQPRPPITRQDSTNLLNPTNQLGVVPFSMQRKAPGKSKFAKMAT